MAPLDSTIRACCSSNNYRICHFVSGMEQNTAISNLSSLGPICRTFVRAGERSFTRKVATFVTHLRIKCHNLAIKMGNPSLSAHSSLGLLVRIARQRCREPHLITVSLASAVALPARSHRPCDSLMGRPRRGREAPSGHRRRRGSGGSGSYHAALRRGIVESHGILLAAAIA